MCSLRLLADRMTERHELFRLRDWLLESGFTSLITVPGEGEDPLISQRHGSMQFMADCVVNLKHEVSNSARRPQSARAQIPRFGFCRE